MEKFCTFAAWFSYAPHHYMSYSDYLLKGFDVYRTWFNQFFKLSVDGKFCGLCRFSDCIDLFVRKLERMLFRSVHSKPLGDVISFRFRGHSVKLYSY